MNTTKKSLLAAMVGLFAAGGMGTVQAQEVGNSDGFELEEIVVTATKRETNLNETPQSIAVIGAEDIERKNLSGIDDYLRFMPGINVIPQGPGRSPVIIRGLSVDPEFEGARSGPTVGTYFGEAPLSGLGMFGGTTDVKLVDIERVEALRGPQGTLFGSNALSGAIRNIPVSPNLDVLEGSLRGSYSNTAENGGSNDKLEGVLNIPIIDGELAIRAVLYEHNDSGYVDNIAGSDIGFSTAVALQGAGDLAIDEGGVGDLEYSGGRIAGLWQPSDDLKVTLSYVKQKGEQRGRSDVQDESVGYTQTRIQFGEITNISGFGSDAGLRAEGLVDEFSFTNLVVEYDLGWASLLSSTLGYEGDAARGFDLFNLFGGLPIIFPNKHETEAFVQELRLTSSADATVRYMFGLFYDDTDVFLETTGHWLGDLELFPSDDFGPIPPPFGEVTQFDYNVEDKNQKQKAVFGEMSYDLTDQLELTLGARWFEYERKNRLGGFGVFTGDGFKVLKGKESDTILMANISYTTNEDRLFYARYAEGFRPGNTQDIIPNSCDVDTDGILDGTDTPITDSFEHDSLENMEVGVKSGFNEGRIQVNAALYRINWTGLPVAVMSPTCFFSVLENAGKAKSMGFELELSFRATQGLVFNIGGSYVNAEMTEDAPGVGAVKGDRLIGAPEYNFNVGFEYESELAGNPLYVRSEYAYVGDFYNSFDEAGKKLGDYGQLNASLGIDFDNFSLSVFGYNITNEDSHTWSGVLDSRASILRPRTLGLTLGYSF